MGIAAIWLFGFIMELEADNQKMALRSNPANRNKFITTGVWKYCRHPNYFGEITMWFALAAMVTRGAVHSPRLHFGWVSPAFTMFLLLGARASCCTAGQRGSHGRGGRQEKVGFGPGVHPLHHEHE